MKNQLFVALIAVLLLTSCKNYQKIDKIGEEGVNLFEKGDIQGALSKYNELIALDNKSNLNNKIVLINLGFFMAS